MAVKEQLKKANGFLVGDIIFIQLVQLAQGLRRRGTNESVSGDRLPAGGAEKYDHGRLITLSRCRPAI